MLKQALALPGGKSPRPADDDDFWYQRALAVAQSGVNVTPDAAMTVSAVASCVRIISESVASLPLIVYLRREDDGKERATKHPIYGLLKDRPNFWQTSFEWREMMQGHACLRGNAYSEILPGRRGAVDQLIPLHPDRVTVRVWEDGSLTYDYLENDGRKRTIYQEQMFHLRGLSSNGYVGVSPVSQQREAIGLSLAMEGYGARFFSQNARPGGILKTPKTLKEDAKKNLKASWQDAHGGVGNAHRVAVLEEGLEWQAIGLSNEDSQFLETRKFQIGEIARIFRVPLFMLQEMEKATSWGTGIEQQSIAFVTYTLIPWLRRWEQAISRDLILATDTYFAEFLVDGLLRGDMTARNNAYAIGRQWGWLSVNDIHRMENRNPIGPAGDTRLIPAGYVEVDNEGNVVNSQVDQQVVQGARRAVRKEIRALRKAAGEMAGADVLAWLPQFYKDRAAYLAKTVPMDIEAAEDYVRNSKDELIFALQNGGADSLLKEWESTRAEYLVALAKGAIS